MARGWLAWCGVSWGRRARHSRPMDVEHLVRRLTAVVATARAEERARWRTVQQVVDQQAEDEVLGFTARTAPEAYLQQELRKLHEAVKAL